MKLEYKGKLEKLREAQLFTVRGSTLLVEILPAPEYKTESGIVFASDANQVKGGMEANRPEVGVVLLAGEGYYDGEGGVTPLDCQPGAVVMLPKYSINYLSAFPGMISPTNEKLGLVKEDQVLAYYKSMEDYEKAIEVLNG